MAKTAAERQAEYRARRGDQGNGERRINTWVCAETYRALASLAKSYGVTKRAVIELLVSSEGEKLKKRCAEELPRNAKTKTGSKKRKQQSTPVAEPKPAQSSDAQYEFDL